MRKLVQLGLIAGVILLAGCQIRSYGENQRFSTWSDADIQLRTVRFPTMLTFPDETMYFYPIYDSPPRADLNLRAISCTRLDDGTLVVTVRVQNMGADIVANTALLTGDLAAFRVVATVTTANGAIYCSEVKGTDGKWTKVYATEAGTLLKVEPDNARNKRKHKPLFE